MPSPTPLTTESSEVKQARLCKAIAAYQPETELHIEKADAMATSRESTTIAALFIACVMRRPGLGTTKSMSTLERQPYLPDGFVACARV
jgi:hypothetical protein